MFHSKRKLVLLPLLLLVFFANAQTHFTQNQQRFIAILDGFSSPSLPSIPGFQPKAQTVGNQYLFENWVPGTVVSSDGNTYSEGYLFNFNKITQNLYIRLADTAAAFLVNSKMLNEISLSDGSRTVRLQHVPSLDSNQLYEVLVQGGRYSLYSFTRTHFVAANYFTNGVSSSGSMYDEFKDEKSYFVSSPDGRVTPLTLKKKTVRSFFGEEKEKLAKFFKEYEQPGIFDENTLRSLVAFLSAP